MNDFFKGILNHYNNNFGLTYKPELYTMVASETADYPYITMDINNIKLNTVMAGNIEEVFLMFTIFDNSTSIENINNIFEELIRIFDYERIEFDNIKWISSVRQSTILEKIDEVFMYSVEYKITIEKP